MEINLDLLSKMGWSRYSAEDGSMGIFLFFEDLSPIMFFSDTKKLFLIKKGDEDDFLFIISNEIKGLDALENFNNWNIKKNREYNGSIHIFKFKSNQDLYSLIKENLSCNKKYKRLLKLNSIFNEKGS